MVQTTELKKISEVLEEQGYIQGEDDGEKIIPASKKEIVFKRINKYEIIKKLVVEGAGLVIYYRDDDYTQFMSFEQGDKVIRTNLYSAFLCSRQFSKNMIKNHKGKIINIASLKGELGSEGQCNYSASKAGMIGLAKSLAKEMCRTNISVNAICPGFIQTDMNRNNISKMKVKMDKIVFSKIEKYMQKCMNDAAHDCEHIYRVLYISLDLAKGMKNINYNVLIAACLLHDIGRTEQLQNPMVCHAAIGADLVEKYLLSEKWMIKEAKHVRECISSHRFRGDNYPETIESKILFDADKLDVTGALGIARSLLYKGRVGEPIYVQKNGIINWGLNKSDDESIFKEYNYKLIKIYDNFYTEKAKKIALTRKKICMKYFYCLKKEIEEDYKQKINLNKFIK